MAWTCNRHNRSYSIGSSHKPIKPLYPTSCRKKRSHNADNDEIGYAKRHKIGGMTAGHASMM